jgi:hypothetical protein
MAGIPSALNTDTEDVVWALQTADALWKRNERVDAVVWLRRAAQAAAEVDDDDRALALARNAAELSEWIAEHLSVRPTRPAAPAAPPEGRTSSGHVVDELLSRTDSPREPESSDGVELEEVDEVTSPGLEVARATVGPRGSLSHALRRLAATVAPDSQPGLTPPAAAPPMDTTPAAAPSMGPPPRARSLPPPLPATLRGSGDVPTAAERHAGMLDPWAESEGATAQHNAVPKESRSPAALPGFDADEVITSVGASSGRDLGESPTSTRAPSLDLSAVDGLSDMPDDARRAFADTAKVAELVRGDEVSGFALALVLDGSVDVAATLVNVSARRLEPGEVLRGRGSIELVAPVRMIASSERVRLATWAERDVADAFRACPWVEAELRSAADHTHALVGVTMGRLGERLDPSMRTEITNRLRLRVLMPHEIVTRAGAPVPGFFVVGAGRLEFLGTQGDPNGQALRAGDFLFPSEAIRAAAAPTSVRAGEGGALALVADRPVAQELLVTCPPLLELFAEG